MSLHGLSGMTQFLYDSKIKYFESKYNSKRLCALSMSKTVTNASLHNLMLSRFKSFGKPTISHIYFPGWRYSGGFHLRSTFSKDHKGAMDSARRRRWFRIRVLDVSRLMDSKEVRFFDDCRKELSLGQRECSVPLYSLNKVQNISTLYEAYQDPQQVAQMCKGLGVPVTVVSVFSDWLKIQSFPFESIFMPDTLRLNRICETRSYFHIVAQVKSH